MAARRSLKDQLAELSQAAPVDLDPEDALAGIDHPEGNRLFIDDSAAREHYIDVAPSAIRKLHDSVNDSKYDGVRTSRKQLDDFSDHGSISEGLDEEEDEEEGELEHSHSEGATEDDEELESPSEGEDASGSESEDGVSQLQATALSSPDAPPANISDPPQENDIASNLRKTHEIDKKKGRAVSRQIALWDTLLDARIQLHKAVTAANRLPLPTEIEQYVAHPAAREALDSFFDTADGLTEELFSLQEVRFHRLDPLLVLTYSRAQDLLRVNESIEPPARKRRRLEVVTEPAREYGEALTALSASASTLEASCHPWLVDTLSKWSAKVQAVAPNVLLPDNKGSFMRNGKAPAHAGVASLIDDVLRSDNTKLLDRTRKRKDKHIRIGHVPVADDERADADVFDDTDYYQQLLRDVIAARGGGDAQGEQQWQAAQRERKAKRRKTVDTKASKGRKLRYDAHPKLQNFMVSVPVVVGEWHEEQIDGLFSSLLQT
ncbi:Protein bfr2 [Trametes pubescens]|uniref:Protein BFR2 n=1 Tax=Trametes pubescens TaxID=154538 RepID=A0A1M2VPV9_TRAPU|nr:Protein bfr2 [Trametes pubescens]